MWPEQRVQPLKVTDDWTRRTALQNHVTEHEQVRTMLKIRKIKRSYNEKKKIYKHMVIFSESPYTLFTFIATYTILMLCDCLPCSHVFSYSRVVSVQLTECFIGSCYKSVAPLVTFLNVSYYIRGRSTKWASLNVQKIMSAAWSAFWPWGRSLPQASKYIM